MYWHYTKILLVRDLVLRQRIFFRMPLPIDSVFKFQLLHIPLYADLLCFDLPQTCMQVLKRNSLSIGLWDTLEETRRVRLKSKDDILEIPKFKQNDSSARLFENETFKISLGADMKDQEVFGVDHHSSSLGPTELPSASPKLSAELNTENPRSNGALSFSDQKAGEENTLTETGNVTSINIVSEPEEALNAVQPSNKSSLPETNSSHQVSSTTESELKSSNHNVLILGNNKVRLVYSIGSARLHFFVKGKLLFCFFFFFIIFFNKASLSLSPPLPHTIMILEWFIFYIRRMGQSFCNFKMAVLMFPMSLLF